MKIFSFDLCIEQVIFVIRREVRVRCLRGVGELHWTFFSEYRVLVSRRFSRNWRSFSLLLRLWVNSTWDRFLFEVLLFVPGLARTFSTNYQKVYDLELILLIWREWMWGWMFSVIAFFVLIGKKMTDFSWIFACGWSFHCPVVLWWVRFFLIDRILVGDEFRRLFVIWFRKGWYCEGCCWRYFCLFVEWGC